MKKLTITVEITDPNEISVSSTSENLTGLESLGLISVIEQHIKDNAFNKKKLKNETE